VGHAVHRRDRRRTADREAGGDHQGQASGHPEHAAERQRAEERDEHGGHDREHRADAEPEHLPQAELQAEEHDAEAQELLRRPAQPAVRRRGQERADQHAQHDGYGQRAHRGEERVHAERDRRAHRRGDEARRERPGLREHPIFVLSHDHDINDHAVGPFAVPVDSDLTS
jgi:hypothetical protein